MREATRLVQSQWKAVRRRANQLLLLKDGRLEDEGTRDDLLERSEEIRGLARRSEPGSREAGGRGLTAGEDMMTGTTRTSEYDRYADEYAAYVATREQDGPEHDQFGILPHMLGLLGDVAGQDVLDAGCGEGYLARILAGRGARVTGIDLSPRLVGLAGTKAPAVRSPIAWAT